MNAIHAHPWALLVLAIALAVLAAWVHYLYWTRKLTLPLEYASEETIETSDGSAIELRRVRVPEEGASGVPVLLVHGIGANHRNQDLAAGASLARHLSSAGRDVWLLTLRCGRSNARWSESSRMRFDAMARVDLPCAIDAVCARTGATQIDYVGFSMGGMLLYAAIGRTVDASRFRRAVTIGSPGALSPLVPIPRFVARLPHFLIPTLRLRFLSRLFAFAIGLVPSPFQRLVLNPKNASSSAKRLAMVNMVVDIPGALLADFLRWSAAKGALSFDGDPVLARLSALRTRALFVAGSSDFLAPPEAVRHAFEAWGSAHDAVIDKRWVLFGREGDRRDGFGHGDLAMGTRAEEEVFPVVRQFLDE